MSLRANFPVAPGGAGVGGGTGGAPAAHAATHATGGSDPVSPASIGAAAATHAHDAADVTSGIFAIGRIPVGTTAGTVAAGDDARLSNARTPTAHASTHASGGTDAVTPAAIGAAPTASPTFTGTPAAPTPAFGTNTTQVATTAFVRTATEQVTALAADTATIGTTLTAVPGLSQAVAASETWLVEWELAVTLSTTTATLGLSVTGPTGATGIVTVDGQNGAPNTGAATGKSAIVAVGTAVATGQFGNPGSTTLPTSVRVSVAVKNSTTAGTVALNLQASTGTLTVKANSFMRARRVA